MLNTFPSLALRQSIGKRSTTSKVSQLKICLSCFFPPIVSWVCISSVLSSSISFSLLRFMLELTLRSSASQLLTLAS